MIFRISRGVWCILRWTCRENLPECRVSSGFWSDFHFKAVDVLVRFMSVFPTEKPDGLIKPVEFLDVGYHGHIWYQTTINIMIYRHNLPTKNMEKNTHHDTRTMLRYENNIHIRFSIVIISIIQYINIPNNHHVASNSFCQPDHHI